MILLAYHPLQHMGKFPHKCDLYRLTIAAEVYKSFLLEQDIRYCLIPGYYKYPHWWWVRKCQEMPENARKCQEMPSHLSVRITMAARGPGLKRS